MTTHLTVEKLSTYLDGELEGAGRRRIERHLESCDNCRARLHGLERVVRDLRALERVVPPAQIGLHLDRMAELGRPRSTLLEQLERRAARLSYPGSLLSLFALVMALVVIIYLLSLGFALHQGGRIPVRLEAPTVQPEGAVIGKQAEVVRRVADREFVLEGDLWVEQGVPAEGTIETLPADDPVAQRLLADHPGLEELLSEGRAIRIRLDGAVTEILPAGQ